MHYFHREKSWHEWTAKVDNGVAQDKPRLLSMLRTIARAVTSEECRKSTTKLTESELWQKNPKLRNWFGNKWLPNIKVQNTIQFGNRQLVIHCQAL